MVPVRDWKNRNTCGILFYVGNVFTSRMGGRGGGDGLGLHTIRTNESILKKRCYANLSVFYRL